MKIRTLSVFIFFLFLPFLVAGQCDDFGIWYGIDTEYPLKKKLDIKASVMIRTFNNASKINQAFFEGGVSYKINEYLSVAGSYRLTNNLEDNSEYHIRHKWIADIKGTGDIGRLEFSGRFRFQRRDKTYFEDLDDEIPDYHGRMRFKTIYKTSSFPIDPFITFETFFRLFEETEKRFDKHRFSTGIKYKINKQHSIKTRYIFQRDFLPHLSDIHLIELSYEFKFAKASNKQTNE